MLAIIMIVCLSFLLFFFFSYKIKKITNKSNEFKEKLEKVNYETKQLKEEALNIKKQLSLMSSNFNRLEENLQSEKDSIIKMFDKHKLYTDTMLSELDKLCEDTQNEIISNAEALWDVLDENKKEFDEYKNHVEKVEYTTTNNLSSLLEIVKTLSEESKIYKEKIDRHLKIDEAASKLNEERESVYDIIKRRLEEIKEDANEENNIPDEKTLQIEKEQIIENHDDTGDKLLYAPKINSETKEIRLLKNEDLKRTLDIDQYSAYELIRNTKNNIFITGKAGTGKSFLIEIFLNSGINKKILLLAPTGTAAVNINGITLHSAFGYKNLETPLDQVKASLSSEKKEVLKNIDIIIIDEISMVRADTFDKIDKLLQIINGTTERFGGKQMILFGDLFQLPPIVKHDEIEFIHSQYDSEFFFSSNSYKNGDFKFIELKENHRQKEDQTFFNILNRIREGTTTDEDIKNLNERMIFNKDDIEFVTKVYAKKEDVEDVNRAALDKLKEKEYVYQAKILYRKNDKNFSSIERSLPIVNELKLKKEAMVLFTKNDPSGRWCNGTRGIVVECDNDKIRVRVQKNKSNGQIFNIGRETFEEKEAYYEDEKIKYRTILKVEQFPLILAYAMSIHKSQGATWEQAAVDVSKCFAPGQAYVALSRCKSLNGLFLLNPIEQEHIIVNPAVKDFYLSQLKNNQLPISNTFNIGRKNVSPRLKNFIEK